ncbi:loricrin-like [Anopheles albimanus]|uniref:Inhibitor of growth protein n=1 Tax=Anopheles albimanus TaxID=7167 RepID=A0A182F926_ANOAL|nr:loricrin-like [Anopheles albimanus]
MISTVTVEAHFSATYVDNYLDTLENLPDDVQRHLSRIRELDVLQRSHIRDVHLYYEQWAFHQPQNGTAAAAITSSSSAANGPDLASGTADSAPPSSASSAEPNTILKRAIARIQQSLIAAQELGDEKLQILQQLHDLIEHRIRLLDQDYMHLGNDFFTSIRLDCSRDEGRLTDGNGADRFHSSGASGGTNNGPGSYGMGGGSGPGQSNNGFGGIGSNAHVLHASNGGGTPLGAGGSGGTSLGSQLSSGGSGGASGIYGGNNGGMLGNERTSKRARRTRNEQQGGGAANGGSNTPNSTCGASPMDVDPSLDCVSSVGAGSGGSDGGESSGNLLAGGTVKQEPGGGLMSGSGNGGNRGGSGGVSGGSASGAGIGGHNSSLSGSGTSGQGQGGNSATLGSATKGNNGGGGGGGSIATGSSSTHGGGGNGGPAGGSGSQSSVSAQNSGGTGKKGTSGGASASREGGSGGGGSGAGGANSGKKKKRKTGSGGRGSQTAREAREETPAAEESVDPDEPTYCLCDQISFGEMILCDNDLCPIEWFHFSCVSLISKPKGRWYCPNCRGDRPNLMKPKQQFLKELERYNKEKEEKT